MRRNVTPKADRHAPKGAKVTRLVSPSVKMTDFNPRHGCGLLDILEV